MIAHAGATLTTRGTTPGKQKEIFLFINFSTMPCGLGPIERHLHWKTNNMIPSDRRSYTPLRPSELGFMFGKGIEVSSPPHPPMPSPFSTTLPIRELQTINKRPVTFLHHYRVTQSVYLQRGPTRLLFAVSRATCPSWAHLAPRLQGMTPSTLTEEPPPTLPSMNE